MSLAMPLADRVSTSPLLESGSSLPKSCRVPGAVCLDQGFRAKGTRQGPGPDRGVVVALSLQAGGQNVHREPEGGRQETGSRTNEFWASPSLSKNITLPAKLGVEVRSHRVTPILYELRTLNNPFSLYNNRMGKVP